MISKKLHKAINDHIPHEFYSAYLYLGMCTYFEELNLHGFSHWLKIQAKEELEHAMAFFDFLIDSDARVTLLGFPAPPTHWESPLACIEAALKHEQKVSAFINKLADQALEEKAHAAYGFLAKFATEQVEEEAIFRDLADKIRLIGDAKYALLSLDRELANRTGDEDED